MPRKKKQELDLTTEEKIKAAARKVFSEKGYFGTRTRDIADEAGINLALVNYYFRSKEKLFELVMQEKVYQLFGTIIPILINPSISLEAKIDIAADSYIDMLIENPELPIMVFNEIKNNPSGFGMVLHISPLFNNSSFIRQIKERNAEVDPMQFVLSFIGLMVFPFIARPIVMAMTGMKMDQFKEMMKERKKYITSWANALTNTNKDL